MKPIFHLLAGCAALAIAACGQASDERPAETGPDTARSAPPAAPAVAADPALGDGGVSDFYTLASAPPAKAGVLIRTEPLPEVAGLAEASRGIRILYSSVDGLSDTPAPVAVSGALFLPRGDAPAGGFPLIAWAHGTVGIADVCAPSNNPRSERDARYLNHWLKQGYAVVASDYQGLGSPGGHPYLATRPAALSVLDSIRAVQGNPDFRLSKSVVLVGQSQGAGAAFATAGEAATYAPELDIRGTVATGTPYFTNDTAPAVRDPNAVSGVLAYSLYIMYLAQQVDPAFKIADYISDKAKAVMETTRTQCLGQAWSQIENEGISQANAFVKDPTPALTKYFPLMAYSTLKLRSPLFMGTGGKDLDVPPPGQERLFIDACKAGSVIERHVYPGLDHSGTVNGSLADSTPFVKKVFAGEPVATSCPGPG